MGLEGWEESMLLPTLIVDGQQSVLLQSTDSRTSAAGVPF